MLWFLSAVTKAHMIRENQNWLNVVIVLEIDKLKACKKLQKKYQQVAVCWQRVRTMVCSNFLLNTCYAIQKNITKITYFLIF